MIYQDAVVTTCAPAATVFIRLAVSMLSRPFGCLKSWWPENRAMPARSVALIPSPRTFQPARVKTARGGAFLERGPLADLSVDVAALLAPSQSEVTQYRWYRACYLCSAVRTPDTSCAVTGAAALPHVFRMKVSTRHFTVVQFAGEGRHPVRRWAVLCLRTDPSFWKTLFLMGHPTVAMIWGAFIGPLIAVASFTCSVGNVPLAAVLWKGGISFGGVASFIYGDLIILPILNIYRKYYGGQMTATIAATFYASMVLAALVVEAIFQWSGWISRRGNTMVVGSAITLNYTTFLDIIFGAVFVTLLVMFFRTGGPEMLRMMNQEKHDGHSETSAAEVVRQPD